MKSHAARLEIDERTRTRILEGGCRWARLPYKGARESTCSLNGEPYCFGPDCFFFREKPEPRQPVGTASPLRASN
jgi:hypothetical protein